MILDPSVIAAVIAGLAAVLGYLIGQRQATLERKRRACAEAMADALRWLELPYRIRRRPNDDPETLNELAEKSSSLREQLGFHEKWLSVEVPQVHQSFTDLVTKVRKAAGPAISDAWEARPAETPREMNVGRLLDTEEAERAADQFSSEVERQLTWWRILR